MPQILGYDNEPEPPTGSKSLRDTSAFKFVEEMKSDPELAATYTTLDDVGKRLIFAELCKEFRRLAEFEDNAKSHCPAADRQLWARPKEFIHNPAWRHDKNYPLLPDESWDNDPENGFKLCDKFRRAWKLVTPPEKLDIDDIYTVFDVEWDDGHLLRDSFDSPLEACRAGGPWCMCNMHYRKKIRLNDVVSSQLLLYRLISVFHKLFLPKDGVSQNSEEGYMTCWILHLVRVDNEHSHIEFRDSRGGASAKYKGSEESSVEALRLINWLISNTVPLSYQGTIAGKCG